MQNSPGDRVPVSLTKRVGEFRGKKFRELHDWYLKRYRQIRPIFLSLFCKFNVKSFETKINGHPLGRDALSLKIKRLSSTNFLYEACSMCLMSFK